MSAVNMDCEIHLCVSVLHSSQTRTSNTTFVWNSVTFSIPFYLPTVLSLDQGGYCNDNIQDFYLVRISTRAPVILTHIGDGLPLSLRASAGILHWLGYNCVIPSPFQFIIHESKIMIMVSVATKCKVIGKLNTSEQ